MLDREQTRANEWIHRKDHFYASDVEAAVFEELCVGPPNADRAVLSLVSCSADSVDSAKSAVKHSNALKMDYFEDGSLVDRVSGKCIGQAADARGVGALLDLQTCKEENGHKQGVSSVANHQRWTLRSDTGEVVLKGAAEAYSYSTYTNSGNSNGNGEEGLRGGDKRESEGEGGSGSGGPFLSQELCLTAGWPFLTGAAFQRPDADGGEVAVVLMNEAEQDTAVFLSDTRQGEGWFGISARSMQTVLYN